MSDIEVLLQLLANLSKQAENELSEFEKMREILLIARDYINYDDVNVQCSACWCFAFIASKYREVVFVTS